MYSLLTNSLLHRYWFYTEGTSGFGVTAYSIEDAQSLLQNAGLSEHFFSEIKGVVEDIDITALDALHVRPNMGPLNFRGVWYPCGKLS